MTPAEGLISALERNWAMVDLTLEGLDEAALARRPNDQCNSIAWTLWHMNRVVDTFVHTRLQSKPQIWVTDGWDRKFAIREGLEDRGVGWTSDEVAAWTPPSREVQMGYYQAVKDIAREYLASLTSAEMERSMVIPPVEEPRTVANAIGQMTWDNVAHGGQIAYLRGLYVGMGWHR